MVFTEQAYRQANSSSNGDFSITPVMSIEKTLDELSDFPTLVEESKQPGKQWNIVFIAGMLGIDGVLPTVEAANDRLDAMIKSIHHGVFSNMIAYNIDGEAVEFKRADT